MTVSIGKAKDIIQKAIEHALGNDKVARPIMLHSSPGIGKSGIVSQICKGSFVKRIIGIDQLPMIDLRLASIESSDLCGIPFVHNGNQKFSVPSWFPTDPNSKGILFLDELSNAAKNVQHAAYRLILDRELQPNVRLPDGWIIVAAGNLKSDNTGATGVVHALANRFAMHLEIEANLSDFIQYAIKYGINEQIIGFLNFNPPSLYRFDPKKNDTAFPTPRSWEFASDWLDVGYDDDDLRITLAGCVGEATSTEFMAYREYYKELPDFSKILNGTLKYDVPSSNLGVVFAVTTSIIMMLLENYDKPKMIKNLVPIMLQLPDENNIMIYKTISQTRDVVKISAIGDVTDEIYQKVKKYIK